MKAKIKISVIARRTGVSLSTVSLALNNKPGISQETRLRILEIAREFEYPIKTSPAIGKSSRLMTIGMVVKTDPDIQPLPNPFYSKVMGGIEESCRRNGINLLFVTTSVDETVFSMPSKHRLPIVLVDGYSNTECYDTVISDNFRAAYQAVEFLIQKGHRSIGLVGSEPVCYPSLQERRNGYLRALKKNDICNTFISNFNINKASGYQETISLLQENPQITALFCVNDNVGSAAIRAARDLGKLVPDDLSIIGYDDTYLAANTHPGLTTMHVDTVAMGHAAVHLLSLRLENPESARMTLMIHPTLVFRQSVDQVAPV